MFSRESRMADQTWMTSVASITMRAGQMISTLDWRKWPYRLIASGPRKICKLPTMWPSTNKNKTQPETAMRNFFPTDDSNRFTMIFIGNRA